MKIEKSEPGLLQHLPYLCAPFEQSFFSLSLWFSFSFGTIAPLSHVSPLVLVTSLVAILLTVVRVGTSWNRRCARVAIGRLSGIGVLSSLRGLAILWVIVVLRGLVLLAGAAIVLLRLPRGRRPVRRLV